jgi:hypothetical protein
MQERTFIGLDVHARSVQAGVLDGLTGEVRSLAVPVATKALVAWVCAQPAPAVTYEAGPTGYELARALAAAGVPCLVAAPSRIPRAPGERVKTDRRDAVRLANLLRLEELTAVRVPGLEEEAARDLVRAREDARGDLMRTRHRLSKLLLRRGIVWEARAWTGAHELWLARQRACAPPAGRGRLAAAPEAGQEPAHSPGAERPAGRGTASAPGLAERRLRRRRLRFDERGKRSTVAAVAVAREEHPRACYEQP